jgi:hypothetical protein
MVLTNFRAISPFSAEETADAARTGYDDMIASSRLGKRTSTGRIAPFLV